MLYPEVILPSPAASGQPRPLRGELKWTHVGRPDLVARARQLVEESGLGREAVAAALGVGVATVTNWRRRFGWVWAPGPRRGRPAAVPGVAWPKLSRRAGPGREHPPETVAAVRRLIEAGGTRVAVAAETGVSVQTVRRWAKRGGWRCPPHLARAVRTRGRILRRAGVDASASGRTARPVPGGQRFRRGRGRRYVPDVVERVRGLVEGTGLSQADIAARTGVGATTVWRWTQRRGWVRPAEAPRWTRTMAAERSGLGSRLANGFARIAALAEREGVRLAGAGCPDAAALLQAGGIADAAHRAARNAARAAARDAPRLVRSGSRRRDRPRADDLFDRARDLVEGTITRQSDIAWQLGISTQTLIAWEQIGGWVRPAGAPSPYGGPARTRRWKTRMEGRIEARHRLGEAERRLDALDREDAVGLDRIEAAFAAFAGALEPLRRGSPILDRPAAGAAPSGGRVVRSRAFHAL